MSIQLSEQLGLRSTVSLAQRIALVEGFNHSFQLLEERLGGYDGV